ncbi:MAG: prenyltransferase/squalene oxidase repeat-containing protein [Planctomycetota bacterium]
MIRSIRWRGAWVLVGLLFCQTLAPSARGLDVEHQAIAREAIEQGLAYLRQTQAADGSWSPRPGPAITGLIVTAMLDQPDIDAADPTVAKGLEYILSKVQADGSIRDGAEGILANYNTAICLSALARVHDNPEIAAVVAGAQAFLKDLQWNVGDVTPAGETITSGHPFVGGAGYGRHGRPDMSNTQFMLQGLYDSGVDCDDPAFQAAVRFIGRCQGIEENDYFPAGTIVNDGGIIYATSINGQHPEIPVSYANPEAVDEARAGRPVSGLRGYGSMTYAGFKSFLYANLDRDDPRVRGALSWIENHYTLEQNPGMPEPVARQGLYYYYLTHARALAAWGNTYLTVSDGQKIAKITVGASAETQEVFRLITQYQARGYEVDLVTVGGEDAPKKIDVQEVNAPREIDWANKLIAKLASLQQADGSFVNDEGRWMENDADLVTAYSVLALQAAAN